MNRLRFKEPYSWQAGTSRVPRIVEYSNTVQNASVSQEKNILRLVCLLL